MQTHLRIINNISHRMKSRHGLIIIEEMLRKKSIISILTRITLIKKVVVVARLTIMNTMSNKKIGLIGIRKMRRSIHTMIKRKSFIGDMQNTKEKENIEITIHITKKIETTSTKTHIDSIVITTNHLNKIKNRFSNSFLDLWVFHL
jgi:hypothetical protein